MLGAGVGDELLRAVDDPLPVAQLGAGLGRPGIGAGLRLGEPEGPQLPSGEQFGKPFRPSALWCRTRRSGDAPRQTAASSVIPTPVVRARDLLDRDAEARENRPRRRRTPPRTEARTGRARPSDGRRRSRTCARGRAPPPAGATTSRAKSRQCVTDCLLFGTQVEVHAKYRCMPARLASLGWTLTQKGCEIARGLPGARRSRTSIRSARRASTRTDARTERALVLLHGFTNCPQPVRRRSARLSSTQGWNVLIPRYPRHGYTDRLNTAISELRAEHLLALANRSADAGYGLGERRDGGGACRSAARSDRPPGSVARASVERAVLIAPMFGLKRIPGPVLPSPAPAHDICCPTSTSGGTRRLKDKARSATMATRVSRLTRTPPCSRSRPASSTRLGVVGPKAGDRRRHQRHRARTRESLHL